jgi:hypothetical protein
VAAAYGWPATSDDEVLARLFALNQARAAPGFEPPPSAAVAASPRRMQPRGSSRQITRLCLAPAAPATVAFGQSVGAALLAAHPAGAITTGGPP